MRSPWFIICVIVAFCAQTLHASADVHSLHPEDSHTNLIASVCSDSHANTTDSHHNHSELDQGHHCCHCHGSNITLLLNYTVTPFAHDAPVILQTFYLPALINQDYQPRLRPPIA